MKVVKATNAALDQIELDPAPFLEVLCGQGRERAARWLEEHAEDVGNRSSVDMQKWFG